MEETTLLRRVNAVDFSAVILRLTEEGKWSAKRVKEAEIEYRQFLYLMAKYPEETFIPWDADVDEFWFLHSLLHRKYDLDCYSLFGELVLYDPKLFSERSKYSVEVEETTKFFVEEFLDNEKPLKNQKLRFKKRRSCWWKAFYIILSLTPFGFLLFFFGNDHDGYSEAYYEGYTDVARAGGNGNDALGVDDIGDWGGDGNGNGD